MCCRFYEIYFEIFDIASQNAKFPLNLNATQFVESKNRNSSSK